MHRPIRILFNTWGNAENVNSQSLTAREIARRLNPDRFASTFFLGAEHQPDAKLSQLPKVHFVRLPARFGSLRIASEMLWGAHDILFYPSLNQRAAQLFWAFRPLG